MLTLPEPSQTPDSRPLPPGDYTSAHAWGIPEAEALLLSGALPSDVWPAHESDAWWRGQSIADAVVQRTIAQVFDRLGLPQPSRNDTSETTETAQPNTAAEDVASTMSLNEDEQQRLASLRQDIAGNGYLDDDGHDPTARWWEFLRREYEAGRLTEHDVCVEGLSS